MNSKRRALVIGGGIAGPTISMFLARAGFESAMFEAYPKTHDVPGGFQIAPNGLRVLHELGLGEEVLGAGHPSRDFCFRNHHGKIIGVAKTGGAGPAVNVKRAPLHRILHEEAARRGIETHYEKRLREVAIAGNEVVVTFEDGSTDVGDVLIGADGIHSRVRRWMHPEYEKPRDTRMISLGGFCPRGFLPDIFEGDGDRLAFIVGPKHQFGYSRMSADQWGWWCHVAFDTDEERDARLAMSADDLKARMLERYRGWCEPTKSLIENTEGWVRTPIHDVPKLPAWHRDRVVLVGDAAHAMSPAGGQGASLALEDSMLLEKLLASSSQSIEASFAQFESLRRKNAEAMVAQGYANDRRSLKELGAIGQWMRDTLLMPMIAPIMAKALNRVYAGDPALRSFAA